MTEHNSGEIIDTMPRISTDRVDAWMNDWARWRAADHSAPGCMLGAALNGRLDISNHVSMVPRGAEVPHWLWYLELAIEAGIKSGRGEAMAVIRFRYLYPTASTEDIAAELRISRRTLFNRLNEARTWLDAWLAAHKGRSDAYLLKDQADKQS